MSCPRVDVKGLFPMLPDKLQHGTGQAVLLSTLSGQLPAGGCSHNLTSCRKCSFVSVVSKQMHVLPDKGGNALGWQTIKGKLPLCDKLLARQTEGRGLLDVVTHSSDTRISPFLSRCVLPANGDTLLDQLTSTSQIRLYPGGPAGIPEQR